MSKLKRYSELLNKGVRDLNEEETEELFQLAGDREIQNALQNAIKVSYVQTFNQIAEREHGPVKKEDIWEDTNLRIEMDEKIENQGPIVHLELIDCYVTAF